MRNDNHKGEQKMIRTAIVEDEDVAANLLSEYISRYADKKGETFSVERFSDGIEFIEKYSGKYDIVFMDIEMKHMDGLEAAKRLRKVDSLVTLIFVTNMARLAVKGYEVDALDFIVKPVRYDDFSFRLDKAVSRIKRNEDKSLLIGLSGGGLAKISVSSIKYIEIMKHNVIFHTEEGNYETYGTLKKIEEQLGECFARCNSCYLVNLKFVNYVRDFVCDVDGEKLKVSQPKKKEFVQALNNYIGG